MPYQRGQFWLRRFRHQAEAISAALAALTKPPWAATSAPAPWQCWKPPAGSVPAGSCSRTAPTSAGLASVTGSRRSPGRAGARRRADLNAPTHQLCGTPDEPALRSDSWMKKPKRSPCSVMGSSPRWCWKSCRGANGPRRAQQSASRLYDIPHSTRRQVSVDTLLEWALRYRRNGLPGLVPQPRSGRGQQRAITLEAASLIERLKREKPHRTGTLLLQQLALTDSPP